jgi:hypothetical protein
MRVVWMPRKYEAKYSHTCEQKAFENLGFQNFTERMEVLQMRE